MLHLARRLASGFLLIASIAGAASGQTPSAPPLDSSRKAAIIDRVARLLNEKYVFPEAAGRMEDALRARLRSGDFDKATTPGQFASAVAQTLASVRKDGHMRFDYGPQVAEDLRRLTGQSAEEAAAVRNRQHQARRRRNFDVQRAERLPGNVGYLQLNSFIYSDEAAATAAAALNLLARCDSIIIDLRKNGGGDSEMIQFIASYFFSRPVHLNDIWERPDNKTTQYWTLSYVPGPRPVAADLFILTSRDTFSGAEEFAYDMQNQKRATIVGETTGGGAHPAEDVVVESDFVLRVPFARAINPVSGTNWEGTGVAPDVPLPADQAFDRAYRLAVEQLDARATDPQLKAGYAWVLADLRAKEKPVRVTEDSLRRYAGTFEGDRKVAIGEGFLTLEADGQTFRLAPMTDTVFRVEGRDTFRLQFLVREGRAVELVGIYSSGRRESWKRTK